MEVFLRFSFFFTYFKKSYQDNSIDKHFHIKQGKTSYIPYFFTCFEGDIWLDALLEVRSSVYQES